jgi:ubiquinone/menaquinone biosynthesis C-methylase UbiE
MHNQSYWDTVYSTKQAETVSWFQPHAALSLEIIERVTGGQPSTLIDVGGGASTLVDDLLDRNWRDVTVLDLSPAALDVARRRLGTRAHRARWLTGDVTTKPLPAGRFDIWHDRAVFHFLTHPADRAVYVAQVRRAVKPGGHVIVAAFGLDGPSHCSGLPVMRFSQASLYSEFGDSFELLEHVDEAHQTPSGVIQHFVYCHCRFD